MVRILLIILFAFLILVVFIPLLLSGVGVDITRGGDGGAGEAFVLRRSGDNGENWGMPTFVRERRDPMPREIFDIAFHPRDQQVLFAGTKSAGLWKSDDAGESWRPVRDRAGTLVPTSDVYRVVISRDRPEVMYLAIFQGNRGRVLKTEDGGSTFRQIYFVGQERIGVFDLYTPPAEPDKVLAASGEGRLLLSGDGGKRWRIAKTFRDPVALLAMHPTFHDEGYLLTSRGELFKTFDGGENWASQGIAGRRAARGTGRTIPHPYTRYSLTLFRFSSPRTLSPVLAMDPYNPSRLYRTGVSGVEVSTGGSAWEELASFIDGKGVPVGGVAVHPVEAQTLFVTAGPALYTSTDRGVNWQIVPFPSRNLLRKIFINPRRTEMMFLTTARL